MTVQVTLTFASTDEMLAYFSRPPGSAAGAQEKQEAAAAAPKPEKPKATKPPAPATEQKAEAPAAAPSTPAPTAAPVASSVDYETVRQAAFKAAAMGPEVKTKALAVAHGLGAATFKDLPADKWQAALDGINAVIAEASNV